MYDKSIYKKSEEELHRYLEAKPLNGLTALGIAEHFYGLALNDIKAECEAQLSLLTKDNNFNEGRWTELNHIKLFIECLKGNKTMTTHEKDFKVEQKKEEPTEEKRDVYEFVQEFVEKLGRIPKDQDELTACADFVLSHMAPMHWVSKKYAWTEQDEENLRQVIAGNFLPLGLRQWICGLPEKIGAYWAPTEVEVQALRTAYHVLTEERRFPLAAESLQSFIEYYDGKTPKIRNGWKPSREQMKQLDAAINAYSKGSMTHTVLKSLYEELKSLK